MNQRDTATSRASTESEEHSSYYEIALTHRQIVISFIVLIIFVFMILANGIWLGSLESGDGRAVPKLVISSVTGALLALLFAFLAVTFRRLRDRGTPVEERVRQLTTSLEDAVRLVGLIEEEVQARSSLAKKLQNDVKRYESLARLTQPEIEAVTQALRGEVVRGSAQSLWQSASLNFVFFLLGLAMSYL